MQNAQQFFIISLYEYFTKHHSEDNLLDEWEMISSIAWNINLSYKTLIKRVYIQRKLMLKKTAASLLQFLINYSFNYMSVASP